jgi:coenzyme F420-reducing hydrogenase delta subunit
LENRTVRTARRITLIKKISKEVTVNEETWQSIWQSWWDHERFLDLESFDSLWYLLHYRTLSCWLWLKN